MEDILGNEKLRLLQTKFYYESLDNGYSGCEYYDFYDKAKSELSTYKGLQDVSEQILKALCYVYKKNIRGHAVNDMCKFLYYWLGNILLKKLDTKLLFTEVILSLFDTLKDYSNVKICKFDFTDIEEDVFNKIKLIFDYTQDYVDYEIDLARPNRWCNEKYHSHLTTYVKTYKELYSKCIVEQHKDMYCQAFKEYYNVNKHSNLYNWSCILKETSDAPSMKVKPQIAAPQEQLEVKIDGGRQSDLLQHTTKTDKQPEQLPSQGVHNTEAVIYATPTDDTSTSTTKSIVTAASAAGLLMPPFLLYNVTRITIVKFTPARSWINKLLGRNQIYRNPLTERELIENSYKPYHLDSERNKYNISYRPE